MTTVYDDCTVAALASLGFAVRGLGWVGLLAFLAPGLWSSDLMAGNVATFATAAMVAVIRWPSVRTVVGYAVLVAVVPKPTFLPVLVYGFWHVPAARRYVVLAGVAGAAMLAWPGYLERLTLQGAQGSSLHLPGPATKIAAVVLTLAGLRWSRLLGLASIAATPYLWPYTFTHLGVTFVRSDHRGDRVRPLRRGLEGDEALDGVLA